MLHNFVKEAESLGIAHKHLYSYRNYAYLIKRKLSRILPNSDEKKQLDIEKRLNDAGGTGIILCLHYIGSDYPRRKLSVEGFERLLDELNGHFIGLNDIDKGGVLLTFDDGILNHYDVVFKMLKKRGIPAVFFVPGECINKDGFFNEAMIKEISSTEGYVIGSHCFHHRPIKYSTRGDVRFQFSESKARLERVMSKECSCLAFPWGGLPHTSKYSRKYSSKSGYKYVFSTIKAPYDCNDPYFPYYIPRNAVTDDNVSDIIKKVKDFINHEKSN